MFLGGQVSLGHVVCSYPDRFLSTYSIFLAVERLLKGSASRCKASRSRSKNLCLVRNCDSGNGTQNALLLSTFVLSPPFHRGYTCVFLLGISATSVGQGKFRRCWFGCEGMRCLERIRMSDVQTKFSMASASLFYGRYRAIPRRCHLRGVLRALLIDCVIGSPRS